MNEGGKSRPGIKPQPGFYDLFTSPNVSPPLFILQAANIKLQNFNLLEKMLRGSLSAALVWFFFQV